MVAENIPFNKHPPNTMEREEVRHPAEEQGASPKKEKSSSRGTRIRRGYVRLNKPPAKDLAAKGPVLVGGAMSCHYLSAGLNDDEFGRKA